jgi:YVTN family beta-propeller protein
MSLRAACLALLLIGGVARADEAFVPNQASDDLTIVDLATMTPGATLPIGGKPAGIAVSRDGARAYVTSPEGRFVTVIESLSAGCLLASRFRPMAAGSMSRI